MKKGYHGNIRRQYGRQRGEKLRRKVQGNVPTEEVIQATLWAIA